MNGEIIKVDTKDTNNVIKMICNQLQINVGEDEPEVLSRFILEVLEQELKDFYELLSELILIERSPDEIKNILESIG